MTRGRHHRRIVEDDYYSSSDSDSRYNVIDRRSRPKDSRRASDRPMIINNLEVPIRGARPRGNSQGGQPTPVVLQIERSPSRHRRRPSSSSSRSHSRHRRPSRYRDERDLPYDIQKKLNLAEEAEQRRQREKLWEDEKYRLERDRDDQERRDRDKRDRILRDMQDERRKEDDRRAAIIHEQEDNEREEKRKREEFARKLREDEAKHKAEEAETRARILADAEAKKKKDEEAAKELKASILAEAEAKKEKDEEAARELKARILREAKEEEEKEKAKKKAAEAEFEAQVRQRAQKAGWSEDYIEDLLNNQKDKSRHDHHHHGHRSPSPHSPYHDRQLLLDYQKPNKWIRVKRIHVLPETLEFYRLPWDYDEEDDEFIMIKQYISHDLQKDLFAHTKSIMQTRRLITPGYEKETITTLKPRDERVIKKKNGEMYVVRKKSVSPAPNRVRFLG